MALATFSHPPWRLKRTSAFVFTLAFLLNTCHGLSEEIPPASESSRDLTKQLLQMDLGYNVLNNEMLRKSMGVSVDTLDNLEADNERLPVPQQLVRDEDVFRFGGPSPDGLWSDEKFWGGGLPQFFGGAFAGNNPRPPHPQRQQGGGRRPQVGAEGRQFDAPKKRQFVGDQQQCGTGSCEFFLFCWLSGGVVEGGCGGIIFACCKRPVQHQSYEEAPREVIAEAQVRFLPTNL